MTKIAEIIGTSVVSPLVTGAVLAAGVKYGSHYVTSLASTSVTSAGIFGLALGVGSIFVAMILNSTYPDFCKGIKEEFIITLGTGISLYAIFALAVKTGLSASSLTPQGAALLIGGGSLVSVAGMHGLGQLGSFSPI